MKSKANRAGAAAGARAHERPAARARDVAGAVLLSLLFATQARALDISPTFVDEPPGTMNRQVWDAARRMVIQRAVSDWESLVLDDRVVNVTFDFSRAGADSYLAQWEGSYALPPGSTTDLYPWTPQVMHRIRFNGDQLLRPGTRMAFVPAAERPGPDVWDALTVARHELAHMMGFVGGFYRANASDPGSDKWRARVQVSGAEATFDPGGLNVPLESSSDLGHVKEVGGYAYDLMTAGLPSGERREVTPLHTDMLKLAYGYQVVPEPGAFAAALCAGAGLLLSRRRRRAA